MWAIRQRWISYSMCMAISFCLMECTESEKTCLEQSKFLIVQMAPRNVPEVRFRRFRIVLPGLPRT